VASSKSQKTALVIEDNFFMAQLLSEKIGHRGITPTHVQTGKDGLAHLKGHDVDLVVFDLPLVGEGWKTLEAIRKSHPVDKLPLIVLMNTPDDKLLKKVVKLGATTLVKADVNADGIVEVVAHLLLGTTPEPSTASQEPAWPQAPVQATKPAPAEEPEDTAHLQELIQKIQEMAKLPEAEVSIIDLVETMMTYAFNVRTSDVHLEPFEDKLIARMRIDGILADIITFPKNLQSGILTRIKVLGGMRTDEHQAAQDGRFRMLTNDKQIQFDVRVSIVPTYYGENAVLRLLTETSAVNSIADLTFSDSDRKKITRAIGTPYGMILATGPTGSGKTTTLYTILKGLNTREVQVITIEDPIEYSLEGVDQIQVNTRTGLTFATGLRSILRQDPNIVMVGEIRDEETASIAVNAALTGHKLLSTIHTNDAATTLPRMLDMGVEPFLVASTINVAIGQRLVRTICQSCKTARRITEGEFASLKEHVPPELLGDNRDFSQGKGCGVCHGTGYHGRMGIYEVLEMNDFIREAVMRRADAGEVKKIAIKNGMTTLLEDGFRKALAGQTTIEEILRVIHE
jgi:type II secretory ATPase GspE/PulE/Tfp pilus assembly ATPase PilB-like protein